MINQLPPELRTKHMILAGVWASKEKPDMNEFFKPFVDEMNDIYDNGVQWNLDNTLVTSRFIATCCCMDSPARCSALCMKQYNGYYGCTFCYQKGKRINEVNKYPISTKVYKLRTSSEIKKQMTLIQTNKLKEIKGVLGPSALMNLKDLDLVKGVTPEPMHTVFLGVTKHITTMFLENTNEPYYIGTPTKIRMIDERLLSLTPPTKVTRRPRTISSYTIWKASEWCSWLLSYILPCLIGILPDKYLNHLSLFVKAIQILYQDSIPIEELKNARSLLIIFVTLFQEYYKDSSMNFIVHLLLHIADSVEYLGPLWAHNANYFENENRIIMNMRKGPSHISKQICKRYLFYKSLPSFASKITLGDKFYEFLEGFENNIKNLFYFDDHILIGNGDKIKLNLEESQLCGYEGECLSFKKIIYKKCRYTTKNYCNNKRFNDSVVRFKNNTYGIIIKIFCISDESETNTFLLCNEIILTNEAVVNKRITHIKHCSINSNKYLMYSINDIFHQCSLITVNNEHYICELPKGCFGD